MNISARFLGAAIVAAAVLCHAIAPATATAQACGAANVTVFNNTPCLVVVNLQSAPPPLSLTLAPYAVGTIPVIPGAAITGIASAAGIVYGFNPPVPPLLPCPAFAAPNITMGPGCCADVLFDPGTCTIWINPTVVPPPCQP